MPAANLPMPLSPAPANDGEAPLDLVFGALADPVRRRILDRLGEGEFLVSEIAALFPISLQAVSRHIQVLVRAGLVRQERSGRISRCRIEAGPIYQAALWLNRYSKYWQAQFELLAASLAELDRGKPKAKASGRRRARKSKRKKEAKA